VLATDVSSEALERAAAVARSVAADNVRFEKLDLMVDDPPVDVDVAVCTGVLHHLPEPAQGLGRIRRSLRPGGVASLMVYSRMHRRPLGVVRRAADLLAAGLSDADERYQLGCQLLEQLLGSERCSPPCPEALQQLLDARDQDRSFVADALIHPLERTYDVDDLLALLQGQGMRLTSWLYPAAWDLATYLDDASIAERFAQLDDSDQWRFVYLAAGYAGPQLELLAERDDEPTRGPYANDDMMAMPLVCHQQSTVFLAEDGGMRQGVAPAFEVGEQTLSGRGRGGYNQRYRWTLPLDAKRVLDACDGETTLGDIFRRFSGDYGMEGLIELFGKIMPHDLGLVAPAYG
jgi:SAM-dependent methyltransferase